jgi:hypothetical protein
MILLHAASLSGRAYDRIADQLAGHNLAYENTAFTIDLIRDFITRK